MKKCFCDRCGAKYDQLSYVHGQKNYRLEKHVPENSKYYSSFRVIDLCPSCQKELEEWLEEENDNDA